MPRNCFATIAITLVIVLAGAPGGAMADDGWESRDYEFASRMQQDFIARFERDLVDPVQRGVRAAKPGVGPAAPATTAAASAATLVPARSPRLPQQMAAAYPSDRRAQARTTFEDLLSGYHRIEKQFGIEPYDVASGLAAFLVGSYMGYHDTGFPDANFKPLVTQLQRILAADPAWAKTSLADRQDMYEQLAIIGMFMANTQMALGKQPDARSKAAMRDAARGYLEQFLKVDAARVQLNPQGLSIQ